LPALKEGEIPAKVNCDFFANIQPQAVGKRIAVFAGSVLRLKKGSEKTRQINFWNAGSLVLNLDFVDASTILQESYCDFAAFGRKFKCVLDKVHHYLHYSGFIDFHVWVCGNLIHRAKRNSATFSLGLED
jgi:hypothetical protein